MTVVATIALVLSIFNILALLMVAHRVAQVLSGTDTDLSDSSTQSLHPAIPPGSSLPPVVIEDTDRDDTLNVDELGKQALIVFVTGRCSACVDVIQHLVSRIRELPTLYSDSCAIAILNVGSGSMRRMPVNPMSPAILWSPPRNQRKTIRQLFLVRATPSYCLVRNGSIDSCGLAGVGVSDWNKVVQRICTEDES